MYSPSFYIEKNQESVLTLLQQYNFATLLTEGSSDNVTHLPFIYEKNPGNKIELVSHMAKANPHWKELEKIGRAKVIFVGPHAYISPAWYQPKNDNVPTWSYAVVHASGSFEIVSNPELALKAMDQIVKKFENHYQTGWQLPLEEPEVHDMLNHIVVFKITNVQFNAKFKLNQKQYIVDRTNVIHQLTKLGYDDTVNLANYMEQI